MKQYLPPQYHGKNVEKQMMYGWRRLVKTPDMNAKFRYVTVVRNLKTYGITMFKVQEKVPGQRKLKDALLGITRSSVVRLGLDKSIVQDWPLRQIKRWAASEGVFTLDFGNHSGEYYMVFTEEGERMSKLLSGYIDLLLKKQRDTGQVIDDDHQETATAEDVASALAVRAVATVGRGPVMKVSTPAAPQISIVDVRQQVERTVMQFAKMAPGEYVVAGKMDAPRFIADVAAGIRMNLDDLMGGDKDRAAAALRAIAPLMEEFQAAYRAAAAAGLGSGVQNLAANEENLLAACRAVNEAVARLLSSPEAMDAAAGRGGPIDRFHPAMFMIHAALAAVASQAVATSMNPVETQRLLHELATNVQLCIRDMCSAAEMLQLKDPTQVAALQRRLVMLGEHMGKLMKLLAPTSSEAQAQEIISELSSAIKGAVATMMEAARAQAGADDSEYMSRMWTSAQGVTAAVDQLLRMTQAPGVQSTEASLKLYSAAQGIIGRLGVFLDTRADQAEIAEGLKGVKEGLMVLVQAAKTVAAADTTKKEGVVAAAKRLIEAIKLLEQALHEGKGPESAEVSTALDAVRIAVAEMIGAAGFTELSQALKATLIGNAAKVALAKVMTLRVQAVQTLPALKGDKPAQEALISAVQEVGAATAQFLAVLSAPLPDQEATIIPAVTSFLPEASRLVSESLTALPSVAEKKDKVLLGAMARSAGDALTELSRINRAYQPHGHVALAEELAPIMSELEKVTGELEALESAARVSVRIEGAPAALNPEQVRETAFRTLNAASRAVAGSIAKLNEMPVDQLPLEADTILKAVRRIAAAVKGLSATTANPELRKTLIEASMAFVRTVNELNKAIMQNRQAMETAGQKTVASMSSLLEAARALVVKELEENQAKKAKVVEDVAERELLGAADIIKAAMARLMAAQSAALKAAQAKGLTLDEAGISAAILDACRNVVQTAGELLGNATEAQRELTGSNKGAAAHKDVYKADAKWEQGLISAAKAVAGSVQFLVKAANEHMKGEASEFSLIAAAKTVAANAAQLQASTKVKLPLNSPRQIAVTQSAGAVNLASTLLVKAAAAHAQAARSSEEEAEIKAAVAEGSTASETQLKIMQMEAQMAIKTIEKELAAAHAELVKLRRERYEEAYAKYVAKVQGKQAVAAAAATRSAIPPPAGPPPASAARGRASPAKAPATATPGREGIKTSGGAAGRSAARPIAPPAGTRPPSAGRAGPPAPAIPGAGRATAAAAPAAGRGAMKSPRSEILPPQASPRSDIPPPAPHVEAPPPLVSPRSEIPPPASQAHAAPPPSHSDIPPPADLPPVDYGTGDYEDPNPAQAAMASLTAASAAMSTAASGGFAAPQQPPVQPAPVSIFRAPPPPVVGRGRAQPPKP